MEEEDIVVGLETVGSRSHDKEELPDSITTGGQVAGLKGGTRPFLFVCGFGS